MRITARRYFLHMTCKAQWRPVRARPEGACVRRAVIPSPELSRYLYTAVGGDWFWIDRLGWTYEQWQELLSDPAFQTWVLSVQGTPAGYYELHGTAQGVEIASFGLMRTFQRQGLGGYLLSQAIECAWALQPRRIWLHTCELDHPHALDNYRQRGFEVFKETVCHYDVPSQPVGPWAGAMRPSHPEQRFA